MGWGGCLAQTTVPSSSVCSLNIRIHSFHPPHPPLLEQRDKELSRGRCGPSLVRISHCLFCQLLLEGQGKPDEEVQRILSQLRGQVGVVSTPSDLQEMLHTVTLLANVVAETRTELTDSALKVRFQSHTGSQLGVGGVGG